MVAVDILTNIDDVIDALGGAHKVAALTASSYTAVCNWRSDNKFPARFYLLMTQALAEHGLLAPPALWGQARRRRVA